MVDAWRTSIVTALEDKAKKESPLEHKLVKFLMGSFVDEIEELEAKKIELEAQIKAGDEENGEEGEAADAEDDDAVDEAQLKAQKKDLEVKFKEITRVVKAIEKRKSQRQRPQETRQAQGPAS